VGRHPPAGTRRDVIFCFPASSVLHDLIPRILYHLLKLFLSEGVIRGKERLGLTSVDGAI
jgi:hypothetical protein